MMLTIKQRGDVRWVFYEKYFDLGIYRWMVRKKASLFVLFGGAFVGSIVRAFMHDFNYIQVWFWVSFPLVVLGGIDHIIIGRRTRLILRILKDQYGIEINQSELIETCRDLIN